MLGAGVRVWSDGDSSKLDPEEWCKRILSCLLNEMMDGWMDGLGGGVNGFE